MKFIALLSSFVTLSSAALNTTREYFIKTELKSSLEYGKSKFDNLWLYCFLSFRP